MVRSFSPELKIAMDLKDEFYEMIHTCGSKEAPNTLKAFIEQLKIQESLNTL
ncbi:MAG: hypothetical protein KAU02_00620 [Tenericutes bacterium]|nr:hypothetical protein [Mycoplasmatota bacterium]